MCDAAQVKQLPLRHSCGSVGNDEKKVLLSLFVDVDSDVVDTAAFAFALSNAERIVSDLFTVSVVF